MISTTTRLQPTARASTTSGVGNQCKAPHAQHHHGLRLEDQRRQQHQGSYRYEPCRLGIKQHWAQITNLTDITSPSFDKTNGTQTSSGNFYWDGQLGFFARVNYSLLDRATLWEANVRHDGSSKFPGDLKWRTFPPSRSAGASTRKNS